MQWDANVWASGAKSVVGTFDTEVAAAECYDDAIRARGGSQKLLNFPARTANAARDFSVPLAGGGVSFVANPAALPGTESSRQPEERERRPSDTLGDAARSGSGSGSGSGTLQQPELPQPELPERRRYRGVNHTGEKWEAAVWVSGMFFLPLHF